MAPGSPGNESELRRAVNDLLHTGPRRGVASLLRPHVDSRSVDNPDQLRTIIHALCAQSPQWIREFNKRLRKKSRCPSVVKGVIRASLSTLPIVEKPGIGVTTWDIIRRGRLPRSSAELTIQDKEELGFGPSYKYFLAKLHDLATRQATPLDLTVQFKCTPVYVHGLALLAAWCERHAARVRLTTETDNVRHYLEATGFREVVEDAVTIDAPRYDGVHHVALTRVQREDQQTADEVAKRIVDLFARHLHLEKEKREPLTVMFAELVENVYRHAQSNYGAYVMAQAFPTREKLHVVVSDTGIGVLDSFRQSDLPDIRVRATSEQAAIELAFEKLVTSKQKDHAGYGLFVVQRLVQRNEGWLRLTSGKVTKEFRPVRGRWRRVGYDSRVFEHLLWNGTEVSLIFNLDRPLPLKEVYAELGPPERVEDFFD